MEPEETARRYNTIASSWDAARTQSTHGVPYLKRAIQLCKIKGHALDVGCGTGHMMSTLIDAGFEVTGLDIATEMMALASARHPTATFELANIVEWVAPQKYDLIVAWDSIFHLPYHAHAPVIEKLCNALNRDGTLVFTAGGIDSAIVGTMFELEFGYSSLSDTALLDLVYRGECVPILMERDQYPLHHVVVIATKGFLTAI